MIESVVRLNDKPFNPQLPTLGIYGKVGEVKAVSILIFALDQLASKDLI